MNNLRSKFIAAVLALVFVILPIDLGGWLSALAQHFL